MAAFPCRVQFLDDTDPFVSTNFPEPTRPPTFTFLKNVALQNQVAGVWRLLKAPHKVSSLRPPGANWWQYNIAMESGEPQPGKCLDFVPSSYANCPNWYLTYVTRAIV